MPPTVTGAGIALVRKKNSAAKKSSHFHVKGTNFSGDATATITVAGQTFDTKTLWISDQFLAVKAIFNTMAVRPILRAGSNQVDVTVTNGDTTHDTKTFDVVLLDDEVA